MSSGEIHGRRDGAATSYGWRTATRRVRLLKLGLAAGFLALAAAVLVAHRAPATGYELSVYRATPTGFWAGLAAAVAASLVVTFHPGVGRRLRTVGAGLAAGSGLALAALPVVRGYHYVGAGDALSHLGWMRDLAAGTFEPTGFLYPAVHLLALFVRATTGVGLPLAVQYVTLAFVAAYLVFVPLLVRAVAGTERALAVGALAALLLLPVNRVSVHLFAHPTTQAVLFVPFALYLVVLYLTRRSSRAGLSPVLSAPGTLLAVCSAALVLVHPQTALNVALVYAGVVAVQWVARRYRPGPGSADPTVAHRSLALQTTVLALAFAAWAPRNDRVQSSFAGVLDNLLAGASPANEVAQRAGSLSVVGGSIGELFVNLFGPSVVFALLAGGLMLAGLTGRLDSARPTRNAFVRYLTAGFVPVFGAFLVFFASSVTTQHFRYAGFIMVLVTVLGAVALDDGSRWLAGRLRRRRSPWLAGVGVRAATAVLLAALVPLAALTAFASPFVFQPTGDVAESQLVGYGNAFEHREAGVPFAGVRSGPERYVHATYGTETVTRVAPAPPGEPADVAGLEGAVPEAVFAAGNLTEFYGGDRYVPVSDRDVRREVDLYGGFRFPASGLRALDATPGIDRVRSNGGFRLYRVAGNATGG